MLVAYHWAWGLSMSRLLDLFKKVGPERYGAAVAEMAPYFGTIAPVFASLHPGYCELVIPHVRAVQNHLGTVHARAFSGLTDSLGGFPKLRESDSRGRLVKEASLYDPTSFD